MATKGKKSGTGQGRMSRRMAEKRAIRLEEKGALMGGAASRRPDTYLLSEQRPDWTEAEVRRWPVVQVLAPPDAVWELSGTGAVVIRRQHPDGRHLAFIYVIDLAQGGLYTLTASPLKAPDKLDTFLDEMRPHMPPFAESTLERAAELVWGSWAVANRGGYGWPIETKAYLAAIPKPTGSERQWHQRLVGPGGLTPDRLVEVIDNMPDVELEPGKELMVVTRARLTTPTPHAAIVLNLATNPERLRDHGFRDNGHRFALVRPYPADHWNPASALPDARQVLADIHIAADHILIEAGTLTRAAQAVMEVFLAAEGKLELDDASWEAPFLTR